MNVRPAKKTPVVSQREWRTYMLLTGVLWIPLFFEGLLQLKQTYSNNPNDKKHQAVVDARVQPKDKKYSSIPKWKSATPSKKNLSKAQIYKIDINQADSAAWVQLPGIGPVLSSRIVKYKKLLRGYVSVKQLKEVYGMSEDNYLKAEPYLECVTVSNVKLSIDSLYERPYSVYHPYWTKEQKQKVVQAKQRQVPSDSIKLLIRNNNPSRFWLYYL
ncbi:MAG: helix-hairpin-helix domain-containing protein [Cytophagaceae bacterium]|jgi:DNA uptake protein ComE-like DNA-binding protein|nr:helix-hairpin-helix domain-containing protein [Cytophagaceae bacterium]